MCNDYYPENDRWFRSKIPPAYLDHQEISKQLRINIDILNKEISEHVDKELDRFKKQMRQIYFLSESGDL